MDLGNQRLTLRLGTPGQTLAVAGAAHALHDGYTDLILLLLPVWQHEFALGYSALALLRGFYSGAMAVLQLPAGRLARHGYGMVLALGTSVTALGYAMAGLAGGFATLLAALALGGAGASVQHPIGSSAVSRAYGARARGPLGAYNFSGDLGKTAIPAVAALLLTVMPWRTVLLMFAGFAAISAGGIEMFMPPSQATVTADRQDRQDGSGSGGFGILLVIGILDSAVRMGFLTFLPFLLKAKGAGLPLTGTALALVFLGGAAGKLACGWLGAKWGVVNAVLATEFVTAAAIVGVLALPLWPALALLPFLGAMLNGTSSVLYGTVPEVAGTRTRERAFALFYTGAVGSSALSPVMYGVLGDVAGPFWGAFATAVTALAVLPLLLFLAPRLRS